MPGQQTVGASAANNPYNIGASMANRMQPQQNPWVRMYGGSTQPSNQRPSAVTQPRTPQSQPRSVNQRGVPQSASNPSNVYDPRNIDFRLSQARWEGLNNIDEGMHGNMMRYNMDAGVSGKTGGFDVNFRSMKEGDNPEYKGHPGISTGITALYGLPAAFGARQPFPVPGREVDQNNWYYKIKNTVMPPVTMIGSTAAFPLASIPAYTAEAVAPDNPWVMGGATVGGIAAEAAVPAVAKKVAPALTARVVASKPAAALRVVGKAFGPVNAAALNAMEAFKPQHTLKQELENEGAWVRGFGPGNSAASAWSRIGANLANNLDKGVDAASYVAAIGTGNPTWLTLSNGSNVKTIRGYADALTNKSGSSLEQRAMNAQLGQLSLADWFGGGKVGGADVPGLVYQKAVNVERGNIGDPNRVGFSQQRFNAWRNDMRRAGRSEEQIQREAERIRRETPYYFHQNIPENMRYATDVDLFDKAMRDENAIQEEIRKANGR